MLRAGLGRCYPGPANARRLVLPSPAAGSELQPRAHLPEPRGRLCVASLAAPTGWRTLIPEGPDTLQTVAGIGGRLYAVYSQAASHRVRIHAADGAYLRELTLPALGSVNRNEGEGVISGVSGRSRFAVAVWYSG